MVLYTHHCKSKTETTLVSINNLDMNTINFEQIKECFYIHHGFNKQLTIKKNKIQTIHEENKIQLGKNTQYIKTTNKYYYFIKKDKIEIIKIEKKQLNSFINNLITQIDEDEIITKIQNTITKYKNLNIDYNKYTEGIKKQYKKAISKQPTENKERIADSKILNYKKKNKIEAYRMFVKYKKIVIIQSLEKIKKKLNKTFLQKRLKDYEGFLQNKISFLLMPPNDISTIIQQEIENIKTAIINRDEKIEISKINPFLEGLDKRDKQMEITKTIRIIKKNLNNIINVQELIDAEAQKSNQQTNKGSKKIFNNINIKIKSTHQKTNSETSTNVNPQRTSTMTHANTNPPSTPPQQDSAKNNPQETQNTENNPQEAQNTENISNPKDNLQETQNTENNPQETQNTENNPQETQNTENNPQETQKTKNISNSQSNTNNNNPNTRKNDSSKPPLSKTPILIIAIVVLTPGGVILYFYKLKDKSSNIINSFRKKKQKRKVETMNNLSLNNKKKSQRKKNKKTEEKK